jgi:hypothetical protein
MEGTKFLYSCPLAGANFINLCLQVSNNRCQAYNFYLFHLGRGEKQHFLKLTLNFYDLKPTGLTIITLHCAQIHMSVTL